MNKTLLILIAGIVVVGGLIGYTVVAKQAPSGHTAGDGHTEAEHATAHTAGDGHTEEEHASSAGHTEGDGHTEADHSNSTESAPHDDTGTAAHID